MAASLLARKAARLVAVIDDLRGRLRRVFAAELSRAVAEAVRDVLAALLGGRPGPARGRPPAPNSAGTPAPGGPTRPGPRTRSAATPARTTTMTMTTTVTMTVTGSRRPPGRRRTRRRS